MNINRDQLQLTLDLDSDLLERFRSVKEVVAAGVYKRGLKRIAGELDIAPGNLSIQLAGDGQRHFDTDSLERYIEKTGDKIPIYFLVAKYCGDPSAVRDEATDRLTEMLGELPTLLNAAGLNRARMRGGRK